MTKNKDDYIDYKDARRSFARNYRGKKGAQSTTSSPASRGLCTEFSPQKPVFVLSFPTGHLCDGEREIHRCDSGGY